MTSAGLLGCSKRRRGTAVVAAALAALGLGLAAAAYSARARPPEPVLLVLREDGVWRVSAAGGRSRLIPSTRGAVAASWAPNGRELAFERGGNVHVVNRDGTGIRLVARGGEPAWSPDGRRLAFSRDGRIVLARRNGRGVRALTDGPNDSRPAWAPDGRRLAFVRAGVVSIVSASGGAVAPVAPGDDPDWSPDGRRIALAQEAGVATAAADGTDLRLIVPQPQAGSPVWSADGSELVVVHDGNMIAYAPDGTAARPLGPGVAVDVRRVPVGAERLPDLDQRAPSQLQVSFLGGRYKLGFASAVDNVGLGPLWIRGVRVGSTMQARQRVRIVGGAVETSLDAGAIRYTWSASHSHWHLLRFESYELRRARDHELVVRDRKSGFCLADHYGHARRVRPAPPFFLGNCRQGEPGAKTVEQGSSVGYTDRYPAHFHGQNVDLTGVPAGIYVLVHRANADGLLRERRYDNNVASVRLRLTRRGGVPAIRVLRICGGSERC